MSLKPTLMHGMLEAVGGEQPLLLVVLPTASSAAFGDAGFEFNPDI
jgi:hypothetical protein